MRTSLDRALYWTSACSAVGVHDGVKGQASDRNSLLDVIRCVTRGEIPIVMRVEPHPVLGADSAK